jgi:hypothetical protein
MYLDGRTVRPAKKCFPYYGGWCHVEVSEDRRVYAASSGCGSGDGRHGPGQRQRLDVFEPLQLEFLPQLLQPELLLLELLLELLPQLLPVVLPANVLPTDLL